jgi:hypothetical protein
MFFLEDMLYTSEGQPLCRRIFRKCLEPKTVHGFGHGLLFRRAAARKGSPPLLHITRIKFLVPVR